MAGYDLTIRIQAQQDDEAKAFFRFLQAVGRRYPVRIKYRTIEPGHFYVTVDGTPAAKIDALFQELILNRGLYYYACSIPSRNETSRQVIKPIFQELLESRFERTYPRLLSRHILGKSTDMFLCGDFYDQSAHKYEMLFRKWDLQMIGNYDFVRDLDDLLTEFMLEHLGFAKGQKSPNYNTLVDRYARQHSILTRKAKQAFKQTHKLRTRGLHRREKDIKAQQVTSIALDIYFFFEFFDEFSESQKQKTIRLNGKFYRRIKYGNEVWVDEDGKPLPESAKLADKPCRYCYVIRGKYHVSGCDMEQCPRCRGQALRCGCTQDE